MGGTWAITFAVAGDLATAALLGLVDLRSGVELAVITVFVYTGIRVAPLMSRLIFDIGGENRKLLSNMEKNGTGGGADAAIAIQKGAITPK